VGRRAVAARVSITAEQTVSIGTLGTQRLRLLRPIDAEVRHEDGKVILWSDDFCTWGSGPHLTAAIRDLQVAMVDYFDWLAEYAAQDKLSPRLQREFAALQAIVEVRP
jgi:hypothetical protein